MKVANSFMELISMSDFGTSWRDIVNFNGYMVSEKGFVMNKKTLKMLMPKPDKDGDFVVSIKRSDGKYCKIPVEWLVRVYFTAGASGDNRVSNLGSV